MGSTITQGAAGASLLTLAAVATMGPNSVVMAQGATDAATGRQDEDVIVVTAGRREQSINEIARTVVVIDVSTLEENFVKTSNVVDLLGSTVPGFGAPTGIDLIRTNTLRGRDPQYLIDGVPLSFNGGSAFRTSPLTKFDPETLGRVEILYGPTAIYGAGAAGGVVQFFTRDAAEEPISVELRQQTTFFPGADEPFGDTSLSWKSSAVISGTLDRFDYVVAASYDSQNAVIDGNGDVSGPTYYGFYDTTNYFAKAGFNITPDQRIQGFFNFSELEEDGRVFTPVPNDENFGIAVLGDNQTPYTYGDFAPTDEKLFYSISYTHSDFFGGDLEAVFYGRDDSLISSIIPLGAFPPPFPSNYQTTQDFEGTGWRLQYARDIGDRASVIVGVDYDDQSQEQRALVYDLGSDVFEARDITNLIRNDLFIYPYEVETLGIFVQAEYEVVDDLRLSLGLRYEEPEFSIEGGTRVFELTVDEDDNQVSRPGGSGGSDGLAFNIGVSYDVIDDLTVFANFSQAVELPSLGQLGNLIPPDATFESAEAIEPQIIDNYEIGLRAQAGTVAYTFAAFFSESDFGENFIYDPETLLGQYNRSPEEIYGFEVTADWEVLPQFDLLGTFSWSEGEFDPDGDGPLGFQAQSALDIQPWKATLNGQYEFNDKTSGNFQWLVVGDRDTAFDDGTDLYEITGYGVVDIGVNRDIGPGVLSVQITNLLDNLYLSPASQTYENNILFNSRVNPSAGRAISLAYKLTL